MSVCAGDWVVVRSKEEILATLDADGRLENMPFQPQMFEYCGKRFRVHQRAHKTCDTVNLTGGRWLKGGVHLEGLRCDGAAYGGCQAACLLFWKEAWLKRDGDETAPAGPPGCSEEDVARATRLGAAMDADTVYTCQATLLPQYTQPLPWWDPRQYVEDLTSKNVTPVRVIQDTGFAIFTFFTRAHKPKWGAPFRWLYDSFQKLWGGAPFPRRIGLLADGKQAPLVKLNLEPGEWVRVRSYEEIQATIDVHKKNRGLFFDQELVPYCGGVYRVRARVGNFIDEKTGKMTRLKTPAVILEDVWCRSHYSDRRVFCPRSIYSWWREAWLERVEAPAQASADGAGEAGRPLPQDAV